MGEASGPRNAVDAREVVRATRPTAQRDNAALVPESQSGLTENSRGRRGTRKCLPHCVAPHDRTPLAAALVCRWPGHEARTGLLHPHDGTGIRWRMSISRRNPAGDRQRTAWSVTRRGGLRCPCGSCSCSSCSYSPSAHSAGSSGKGSGRNSDRQGEYCS